eukprot:574570-Pleurochrysis_carterae.AAC.2
MRARVGTGPAAGVICHSRLCTSGVVSGSIRTGASAARLPASPVSDFSATSFDVAAAGSSPSAGSVRAAPFGCAAAGPALPPCRTPRGAAASSSAISRSAASAQPRGGAVEPHTAAAPPAPRTSESQSSAAARTAGSESGASRSS